tara:strand:+ start:6035 stop:7276 length:1242 start_codon:yes stop_codon:yes gene_type:complete
MNKKPGYKKTKLGWIPEEWEVKKMLEIGWFKNGMNKEKEDYGSGLPFVNLMDVFDTTTVDFNDLGLVETNPSDIEKYGLKKGDVLFVRSSVKPSGVGLAALVDQDVENVTYSGFIIRFREKGFLDNGYKKYCFNEPSFRYRLKSKSTTSANTNINQQSLGSLRVSLPPLPEQKKIAEILSIWDEAIQKTEALIQKKEQLKKGLMQQLLTGKTRFDGFEGEWKSKPIKSFSNVVTGSTPRTNEPKFYEGDYLFVSPSDMGNVKYIKITEKTLTKEGFEDGRKIPKGATLFVSIGSTIGKTAIAGVDLTTNQQIHAIITGENICLNEFFYYQLSRISERIKLLAGKQAVPILNKSNFQSLRVSLPSIKEQEKIVIILSGLENEIEVAKKIKQVYQKQKKGLKQQLLTGKTRVGVS